MSPGAGDDIVERETGRGPLAAEARRLDAARVGSLLATDRYPLILLRGPDDGAVASAGTATAIRTAGPDRFSQVRDWGEAVADRLAYEGPTVARPRFLGGFAFDGMASAAPPWEEFPAAWFMLPAVQLVRAEGATWLTVVTAATDRPIEALADSLTGDGPEDRPTPDGRVPSIDTQDPVPSRPRWLEQVREIQRGITADRFRKAVLGHTTEATLTAQPSPVALATRLSEADPGCYRFLLSPAPGTCFLGASPERLVEGVDRTLRTDALAGSRRRGDGPTADRDLATDLRASEKDTIEHEFVVDAIRERLETCCRDVGVGERSIRRLASVQHLHTELRATRPGDCHLLDVARELHPTPAVGGMPRRPALAALDRVESFDRGWYAGPIGWFDGAGDGQFAIGIRSAVVDGCEATLFAGAGIIAESEPATEWEELQLKYEPIRATFGER